MRKDLHQALYSRATNSTTGATAMQSVKVFPRRRGLRTKAPSKVPEWQPEIVRGRQPFEISEENVRSLMHLPQKDAARLLGISLTAFKNVCRKLGSIGRWPYRGPPRRKNCIPPGICLAQTVVGNSMAVPGESLQSHSGSAPGSTQGDRFPSRNSAQVGDGMENMLRKMLTYEQCSININTEHRICSAISTMGDLTTPGRYSPPLCEYVNDPNNSGGLPGMSFPSLPEDILVSEDDDSRSDVRSPAETEVQDRTPSCPSPPPAGREVPIESMEPSALAPIEASYTSQCELSKDDLYDFRTQQMPLATAWSEYYCHENELHHKLNNRNMVEHQLSRQPTCVSWTCWRSHVSHK